MAASSSVVIKVTHGDTVRRFNGQIVGDGLNLNMDGLRKKIFHLFSFGPDTELVLTYIDEDDDVVTLADDDDLRDVVKQELNPLRITVKLNAEKNAPYTRSSASSTPLRSSRVSPNLSTGIPEILKTLPGPLYETLTKIKADMASKVSSSDSVHEPVANLNSGVSQVPKMVPEPIHESIGKLSSNLASIAKISADILFRESSTPGIMELVDNFSKVGLSYLDHLSQSQPGVNSSSTEVGTSEVSSGNNVNFEKTKPEATVESNEVNINTVGGGTKTSDLLPNSRRVYPKSAVISHSSGKKESVTTNIIMNTMSRKSHLASRTPPVENNAGSSISSCNVPCGVNNFGAVKEVSNPREPKVGPEPANVGSFDSTRGGYVDNWLKSALSDGFGKNARPIWAPSPGRLYFPGPSPMYECPFSGLGPGNGSTASPIPATEVDPFRRSISQNDCSGNIFHRGVRCDGCGVHPITGPRFKSKVKVDYDLCNICFAEMGNNSDYIRMDRPVVYRQQMSFKGLQDAQAGERNLMLHQQVPGSFKVKPVAQKLDSRFIRDVNIFDGTVMAPLTPFTKIWRMKNNGTDAWPQKVQLVWIGGDKLNNELAVDVQVPVNGLMIDEELEVAVDFISPELPGRYISYWRMALPSGLKFGQRVWVLIQVDASLKEAAPHENFRNLNLNLPPPPTGSSLTGPGIINVETEPMVEDGPAVNSSKNLEEFVQPNTEQELKFPINDSLLVGNGQSSSCPVSYPIIDLSDVAPAIPYVPQSMLYPVQPHALCTSAPPVSTVQKIEDKLPVKVEVEEKLLKELEEMGFKEVDLNKRMLRMNEYDLEQALDDLCGVSEWDPILEELQEMGFHDKETNRMLLKKNNGSIKRVVMDLIAGEKSE